MRMKRFWGNRFIMLTAILAITVAYLPNIQEDLIPGADWMFHMVRIETMSTALKSGIFPIKFHSDLCYGFGYGVGFFYPNLFLYIPAILINFGLSIEVAYKLFAGFIFIAIYCGMFFAIWCLTKNETSATLAAVMYVLSISTMKNFYSLFALGRSLAMIFVPLATVGMLLWCKENKGGMLLGIGFTGLIYSHVLSVVLTVLACFIIALVYIHEWLRDWTKIRKMLVTIISVCTLTAAFWLPMIEQWTAQKYRASEPWAWVDDYVIRPFDLLSFDSIGWILVAACIVMGFYMIERKVNKDVKCFYFIGLGFFLLPSVSIFWRVFRNVFKFLQFPSRLFSLSATFIIVAFVLWINSFSIKEINYKMIVVFLLICNIFYSYSYVLRTNNVNNVVDLAYTTLHEDIAGLGSGEEWLPLETTRDDLIEPDISVDDKGNHIIGKRVQDKYILDVTGNSSTYYNIPFVWYKGFKAIGNNGEKLQVTKNPENGLVCVNMLNYDTIEQITVWYSGTALQTVGYVITCLSVLVAFIYFGIAAYRKNIQSKKIAGDSVA